ncbi:MAG: FHA domain-containing protein, partial [Agromyces sp.]
MTVRLTIGPPVAQGAPASWVLKVDEATTVGEVAESLGVTPGALDPSANPSTPFAESAVLSGADIPAKDAAALEPGTLRLEVVGGPFAGETLPLVAGRAISIGSAGSASLVIADPALAAEHAVLTVNAPAQTEAGRPAPLSATIAPAAHGATVWVNGDEIEGASDLVPADHFQLGNSMFRIGLAPGTDADLTRDALGGRGFNRPSRIKPSKTQPVVMLPGDKPEDPDQSPMPWLSAIIPVVLGVTMAMVFQRPIMLLMAAASPIMVVGSFLANRKLAKKKGVK